jgi:hypothetical protein
MGRIAHPSTFVKSRRSAGWFVLMILTVASLCFHWVVLTDLSEDERILVSDVCLQNPSLVGTPDTPSTKNDENPVKMSTTGMKIPADETKKHDGFLLNVPFFVYEDLLWFRNITFSWAPSPVEQRTLHDLNEIMDNFNSKHYTDVYFARAALQHPMRTLDPSKAKLFVVPTLLNLLAGRKYRKGSKFCYKSLCNRDLVEYADDFLANSRWFQRHQGSDHIVVRSEWYTLQNVPMPNIRSCHEIRFEDRKYNNANRFSIPDYYVGQPCTPTDEKKEHDFAMIATLEPGSKFLSRQRICDWLVNKRTKATPIYDMPICGKGLKCPTLAKSKFGFHVRGDTFGANRLMDTLLSETVPVFTMKEQYSVLPDWIDWDRISYFANVANQTEFLSSIARMAKDEPLYQQKYRNAVSNRDLFDWATQVPFDTYMYMLSSKLWPELVRRNATSRYSALILPS